MPVHKILRSSLIWAIAFGCWCGVLFSLSSRTGDMQDLPAIPLADKFAHLAYFAAGGFLLAGIHVLSSPHSIRWPRLFFRIVLSIAVIGALDEYHQSFVPGRSGNDPYDLLADILGGFLGVLLFRRIRPLVIR